MKELPNKSLVFFKERFMVGYDFNCPGFSLTWHRCNQYWSIEVYPFYIYLNYGKSFDKWDEDSYEEDYG